MQAVNPQSESRNPSSARPTTGLARTFAALAQSTAPAAQNTLFSALESPDPRVQAAAANAILRFARADGLPRLIAVFPQLAPPAAAEFLQHVDELAHALRDTLASGAAPSRAAVVEIVRRSGRVQLAYLLVDALSDADARVAEAALEALSRLADAVRREPSGDLARSEIEARRFALLDPVLAHLSDLARPQPDGLLMLAMGLDPRANDLLLAILASRQDPRAARIERLVMNAAAPNVVSFLYDALRDHRGSALAAGVFQSRRDLPFVRATLANPRFFSDFRVRESLRFVRSVGPLAAPDGSPRPEAFSSGLVALRAVHFIALSGAPLAEKLALLDAAAAGAFPEFVKTLAETAAAALRAGRSPIEVSAALAYLEGEVGQRAAQSQIASKQAYNASEQGDSLLSIELELELPWAHPETAALPADAFTQFFNAFDRLDDATKRLAAENLRRLDPSHLDRLRQELAGLDPERRLRAVKALVALHGEHDLEGALLTLSSDPDRHVRATVVKSLGILEDERATRALLEAVNDPDRRVVANTVEAIEQIGREEFAELVRILATHPNNRIRANAIKALWTMGARDALSRLDTMLADPDEMMRLSATWLLGEVDHPQRIEILRSVAGSDPSERVRAKAKSILGETA